MCQKMHYFLLVMVTLQPVGFIREQSNVIARQVNKFLAMLSVLVSNVESDVYHGLYRWSLVRM